MKFFRVILLLITVAAFAAAPFALNYLPASASPPIAQYGALPIVGQTFPIAGQDAVPEVGIVLRAQDECEVGELVRLDATESDVDGLTWQILPATPDFEIIEDGRRAFFSARGESAGKSFLIIVAGAKGGQPYLTHHTIDVIGVAPEPGPETLATTVRRWVRNVEEYEGRKVQGLALAQVFRKLATADDITVEQILEATATANSAVLGDNLQKWLPFLEPLGQELDTLTEAGKLCTREDYKNVWLSIADGIEKGL